jgi:hypothetical protein
VPADAQPATQGDSRPLGRLRRQAWAFRHARSVLALLHLWAGAGVGEWWPAVVSLRLRDWSGSPWQSTSQLTNALRFQVSS